MNKLDTAKRAQVVAALVEGNSIRATVRMTGVAKNTVQKLLLDLGAACEKYQDEHLRNLPCTRIQVDEIWAFCYSKQKNVPEEKKGMFGYGDVWTFVGIDADTKLVPAWRLGRRNFETAMPFVRDLAARLANRVQVTTDAFNVYVWAMQAGFKDEVDFAQLQKLYGADTTGAGRYSPPKVVGVRSEVICGEPAPEHVSTSFVERQNLTMRMGMRRFTRLTNGFSKKVENLRAAVALHFMHYNFCRIHKSLRVTPAMAAGVTDHAWEIEEIVRLLEIENRIQASAIGV